MADTHCVSFAVATASAEAHVHTDEAPKITEGVLALSTVTRGGIRDTHWVPLGIISKPIKIRAVADCELS